MSRSNSASTKANHYNRESDGSFSNANFLILGWVEGFDKNWNNLRSDPEYQRILAVIQRHWERYREEFGGG